MSRPWMPFYIAEYLGDTGHLNTTQHGAYFLLIIHYWRTGGLPDDDRQLANITKLPLRIWNDVKPIMQDFFFDGWKHKRIDKELAKQDVIATKRAIAGRKGADITALARMVAKAGNCQANAHQLPTPQFKQLPQQLPSKRVAVTKKDINTYSSPVAARERQAVENVERPQEATEVETAKPPSQTTRSEFDDLLTRKLNGGHRA